MRSVFLIALVGAAAMLAACGDDSKEKAAPAGTTTTSTSPSTKTQAEGESRRSGRERSRRGRGRSRGRSHPSRETRLSGIERAIYHESRARCRALPLAVAAMRYRARSREPGDVAEAYAKRTYPSKPLQKAAREGCLAALGGKR